MSSSPAGENWGRADNTAWDLSAAETALSAHYRKLGAHLISDGSTSIFVHLQFLFFKGAKHIGNVHVWQRCIEFMGLSLTTLAKMRDTPNLPVKHFICFLLWIMKQGALEHTKVGQKTQTSRWIGTDRNYSPEISMLEYLRQIVSQGLTQPTRDHHHLTFFFCGLTLYETLQPMNNDCKSQWLRAMKITWLGPQKMLKCSRTITPSSTSHRADGSYGPAFVWNFQCGNIVGALPELDLEGLSRSTLLVNVFN